MKFFVAASALISVVVASEGLAIDTNSGHSLYEKDEPAAAAYNACPNFLFAAPVCGAVNVLGLACLDVSPGKSCPAQPTFRDPEIATNTAQSLPSPSTPTTSATSAPVPASRPCALLFPFSARAFSASPLTPARTTSPTKGAAATLAALRTRLLLRHRNGETGTLIR